MPASASITLSLPSWLSALDHGNPVRLAIETLARVPDYIIRSRAATRQYDSTAITSPQSVLHFTLGLYQDLLAGRLSRTSLQSLDSHSAIALAWDFGLLLAPEDYEADALLLVPNSLAENEEGLWEAARSLVDGIRGHDPSNRTPEQIVADTRAFIDQHGRDLNASILHHKAQANEQHDIGPVPSPAGSALNSVSDYSGEPGVEISLPLDPPTDPIIDQQPFVTSCASSSTRNPASGPSMPPIHDLAEFGNNDEDAGLRSSFHAEDAVPNTPAEGISAVDDRPAQQARSTPPAHSPRDSLLLSDVDNTPATPILLNATPVPPSTSTSRTFSGNGRCARCVRLNATTCVVESRRTSCASCRAAKRKCDLTQGSAGVAAVEATAEGVGTLGSEPVPSAKPPLAGTTIKKMMEAVINGIEDREAPEMDDPPEWLGPFMEEFDEGRAAAEAFRRLNAEL